MRRELTLALALGAATLSGPALAQTAKAPGKFDGNWSVQVLTEKGDCEKVYRYPIKVQAGAISYGGTEDFTASGGVSPNGAVRGKISRSNAGAEVTGRVSGTTGTGT